MNAPTPYNEAERLQALSNYHILDTPPEVAFERLTSLAAQVFSTPIALVSLVDANRQWFKSCFGTDMRQTDRRLSLCAYAILSEEVMVVQDASIDPRFSNNTLVTSSPYIRSYMGAPIRTSQGQNLGSLCILDTVPRQFSAQQQSTLAALAAIVMDELELRRAARELRENEAILRQALRENSQLAVAVANLTSGAIITDPHLPDNPIIYANQGFYNMTGYSASEVIGYNCRFLQGPKTDPAIVQEMRNAIKARRQWQGVVLDYRKDGTPFVNEVSINPVFDEGGNLLNFVGLQNDVTEREKSRELLEQRVQERTADLANSQIEILNRLAHAAEFRDDDTGQHTRRVAHTAALLARAMGLPADQVTLIEMAAPLHDVGKIAISDLVLLKPAKLTDAEFATMKNHAAVGAALLSDGHSEVVQMAERIARTHHERWDGQGYPHQLEGVEIPIEGRILAVADVFDALTRERPYKPAWPVEKAVMEIQAGSGSQFDPSVVEAFLTLPHAELL